MSKSIGSIIRKLRCSRNLTQEQLAENLNVTTQAVSKWETCMCMPDISQVVPIAHFFGVSTDTLFGIEEENEGDAVQSLINTATSQDSYTDEYALLKEALQTYPGDVRLLLELISCGVCLLEDETNVKATERNAVFEECERAGRLILSYSKDLNVLIEATEWLIKLYCEIGETEKAIVLSEMLPSKIGFNKEAALGRIYESYKDYEKALESYSVNISQFQTQLIHSIVLCGNMYNLKGDKKNAVRMYSSAIALSEKYLENNPIQDNKVLRTRLENTIEKCNKAIKNM